MGHSKHRHVVNLRLERWHRFSIYAALLSLLASGSVWIVVHYFFRVAGEFGETVHPLEPLMMKLHGAGAMLSLFFIGSLMNSHIRRALKSGRNLASGRGMIVVAAILVVSGYGLYYLASESSRPTWSAIHWITGLVFALLIVLHVQVGRQSR